MRADVHGHEVLLDAEQRARGPRRRVGRRAPREAGAGRGRRSQPPAWRRHRRVVHRCRHAVPRADAVGLRRRRRAAERRQRPGPARREHHAVLGPGPRVRARRGAGRPRRHGRGARSMAELAGVLAPARASAAEEARQLGSLRPAGPGPALAGHLLRPADAHPGLAVAAGGVGRGRLHLHRQRRPSTPTPCRSTGRSCCARSATPRPPRSPRSCWPTRSRTTSPRRPGAGRTSCWCWSSRRSSPAS